MICLNALNYLSEDPFKGSRRKLLKGVSDYATWKNVLVTIAVCRGFDYKHNRGQKKRIEIA